MPAGEALTKPKKAKSLKKNILTVKNNDNKCDSCNKSFSCPQILHSHFVNIHLTIKFKCEVCFEYFVHPSILNKHFQEIHGLNESWNANLECEICNKNFNVKEKLMLHIKSTYFKEEKEQISHSCDSCDQTKHEINRQKMDKSVSKPCPNCRQMILSERLLARHLGNCKPKNKNL